MTAEEERNKQLENEAQAHLENNNIVPANTKASRCVDGGYTVEQAAGSLARPGADAGLTLGLVALKDALSYEGQQLSTQKALDLTTQFVTDRLDRRLDWHTDSHAHAPGIGCGHLAKASTEQYAPLYGVKAADAQELVQLLHTMAEADADQKLQACVNLHREHAEKGVYLVMSTDLTVNPWDLAREDGHQHDDTQYFVYDVARDTDLRQQFVTFLTDVGVTVTDNGKELPELFNGMIDQQNNATLSILAPGKPLFTTELGVSPDGEKTGKVTFAGMIPAL